MSENGRLDELEFDSVRSRLESGFYPTLVGPGPELIFALALAFTQPVLWFVPGALTFLILAIAFFIVSTVMALRARSRGHHSDAMIVALAAATIFVWSLGVYFSFASHSVALIHAILASSAFVIAGARHANCFRYAATMIDQRTEEWREEDLANYAEFLLARRPGPGSKIIARRLYERASLMVLDRNWPIQRQINIVERYVTLLERGVGGRTDDQGSAWWREKVEDLKWWTRVRNSGSRSASASEPADAGDGKLAYHDMVPVWRARMNEGTKYQNGGVATMFHAFLLPDSALVACVVRLPGGDGASTVLHHVFDVSSPESETYLAALEHRLSWRIEVYRGDVPEAGSSGPAPELALDVSLDRSGLMEAMDAAMIHNNNLGQNVDGPVSMAFYLKTIEAHRGRDGIDSAWSEIESACLKVDD